VVDPSPFTFLDHAHGPVYMAEVLGSGHDNFCDEAALVQMLSLDPSLDPTAPLVGTIDPGRARAIESAYLRAFFGGTLRDEAE
jgi:hypothetical protein